jgi:predicted enzyme related to lactoylglutathione lyase
MKKLGCPSVVRNVITLFAVTACAPTPDASQESGPFTGQVKPVLYVQDVEASAPFFQDVLGFEFLGYSNIDGAPYYAEMAAGSLKFGLHNAMSEEQEGWIGHQRIYFRVRHAREFRSEVISRGASPGELIETDWMDMFIVRDLDGHEIVLATTDPAKHAIDPW